MLIMTLFSKLGSYDCGTCGSGPLHLSPKDGWPVAAVSSSTSTDPAIRGNDMHGFGPQDARYGQGGQAPRGLAGDKSRNIGRADPVKRIR